MSGKLFYEKSEILVYLLVLGFCVVCLFVYFFYWEFPFLMHLQAVLVNSPGDCGGHRRTAHSTGRKGIRRLSVNAFSNKIQASDNRAGISKRSLPWCRIWDKRICTWCVKESVWVGLALRGRWTSSWRHFQEVILQCELFRTCLNIFVYHSQAVRWMAQLSGGLVSCDLNYVVW